jgi:hypothetical protein
MAAEEVAFLLEDPALSGHVADIQRFVLFGREHLAVFHQLA